MVKKGACPDCDGLGIDPEHPGCDSCKCKNCGGTGWVEIYPEVSNEI
jgi:hypothetical protein